MVWVVMSEVEKQKMVDEENEGWRKLSDPQIVLEGAGLRLPLTGLQLGSSRVAGMRDLVEVARKVVRCVEDGGKSGIGIWSGR